MVKHHTHLLLLPRQNGTFIQLPLRIPMHILRHGHTEQPLCLDDAWSHVVFGRQLAKLDPIGKVLLVGVGNQVQDVAFVFHLVLADFLISKVQFAFCCSHGDGAPFPHDAFAAIGFDDVLVGFKATDWLVGAEDCPIFKEFVLVLLSTF